MGVENPAPTLSQFPDCTGRSRSLYQLHNPIPQLILATVTYLHFTTHIHAMVYKSGGILIKLLLLVNCTISV
jgi:hypothetical protein